MAQHNGDELQLHSIFDSGQRVVLTIGGLPTECTVYRANGGAAVLIPLRVTPELQAVIQAGPIIGQVKRSNGTVQDVTMDSTVSLVALVTTVRTTQTQPCRRKQVRIKFDFEVELSTDVKIWHKTHGEDISEGGMLVTNVGLHSLSIGQSIAVRIYLPGLRTITAVAAIKRLHPSDHPNSPPARLALQFTKISVQDSDSIVGFIYYMKTQHND